MSIRHSLLAILSQGPCYGYQLRHEFDRRTGATWPLNVGQIYNTLDRLERDGFVAKADTDPAGHVYYAITEAGGAEVDRWFDGPVVRTGATRDELAIKLAMAVTLPGGRSTDLIQAQREAANAALDRLISERDALGPAVSGEEVAASLILESRILAADAERRWLDHAESSLARVHELGLGTPVPLRSEPPKRGRPLSPPGR